MAVVDIAPAARAVVSERGEEVHNAAAAVKEKTFFMKVLLVDEPVVAVVVEMVASPCDLLPTFLLFLFLFPMSTSSLSSSMLDMCRKGDMAADENGSMKVSRDEDDEGCRGDELK